MSFWHPVRSCRIFSSFLQTNDTYDAILAQDYLDILVDGVAVKLIFDELPELVQGVADIENANTSIFEGLEGEVYISPDWTQENEETDVDGVVTRTSTSTLYPEWIKLVEDIDADGALLRTYLSATPPVDYPLSYYNIELGDNSYLLRFGAEAQYIGGDFNTDEAETFFIPESYIEMDSDGNTVLDVTLSDGSILPLWAEVIQTNDGRFAISVMWPNEEVFEEAGLNILVNGQALTVARFDAAYQFITYTPDADTSGTDVLTYTVGDGDSVATNTLTIDIVDLEVAPNANDDEVSTAENTAIFISYAQLFANDYDSDGDPIRLVSVQGEH